MLNPGRHFRYYSAWLNQIDRQFETKLPNELLKDISLNVIELSNYNQIELFRPVLEKVWECGDKPGLQRLWKQARINENPPASTIANAHLGPNVSKI